MKLEKELLRNKFIKFQQTIADLKLDISQNNDLFKQKEIGLFLGLFEILDALENVEKTIESKKKGLDKTSRMLGKNIRSIHKKLLRIVNSADIIQMSFPDNKATMEECKIIDTQNNLEMENETIINIIKNGYINKNDKTVLRKAEVITISNNE